MKKFLFLILLAIVITLVAIGFHNVPSYILLQVGRKSIAAPLWLVIDAIIVLVIVVAIFSKIVSRIASAPKRWRLKQSTKQLNQQLALLSHLNIAWIEEDYQAVLSQSTTLYAQKIIDQKQWLQLLQRLIDLSQVELVYVWLKKALKQQADPMLFQLLGGLEVEQKSDQLKFANKLFKNLPESVENDLAMAKICQRNGLDGKARAYEAKAESFKKS